MNAHSISRLLNTIQLLQLAAVSTGQRRILVVSGDKDWCRKVAQCAIKQLPPENRHLWVGEFSADNLLTIPAGQSKQWLGRELDFLVFDAWSGFDVDAFGALSGTLCAGGLLLLLTPELDEWAAWSDPEHRRIQVYPGALEDVSGYYLQRLARLIANSGLLTACSQKLGVVSEYSELSNHICAEEMESNPEFPCKTRGQEKAVAAVHKVLKGHRRRPLVLTADRGRGKSAALGIAAGQLINQGVKSILVTAPARKTTEVLYHRAAEVLDPDRTLLPLRFIAPDELVHELPEGDLLLVDEAAAIPAPMLEQMLDHYSRVVYASTIHGYEGTGRGFAIRFRKILDEKTPQWRSLHISQPIRWAANDPLEAFVFESLLLNAEASGIDQLPEACAEQYEFRVICSAELIENEALLQELFGLLIQAHYQTRPFDLRHMLDGGNIEIYGLFLQGHLVATALGAREGEIDSHLQESIWLGLRRVRGHLLPQSLSHHLGIQTAITLKGMRIIRIAVHPDRQQQGLGLLILRNIEQALGPRGFDYLGTSFGASEDLLDFWHKAGLKPVRLGVRRDAASGSHSVLMIKPLSRAGEQLLEEGRVRFQQQFQWLLPEQLQAVEAGIVVRLLKQLPVSGDSSFDEWLQRDLYSYCQGQRQYDSCIAALKIRARQLLVNQELTGKQQRLLVGKVLQNRSWSSVAQQLKLPGRKQAQAMLREIFAGPDND